jgi:hypothetical protein
MGKKSARKDVAKQESHEHRAAMLQRIAKLEGPNFFTQAVDMPADLAAGIITSRPELLRAVRPRALNEQECAVLYNLLSTLIETNMALREHAQEVATMTKNMMGGFTTVNRVADQLKSFANFDQRTAEEEEDHEQ